MIIDKERGRSQAAVLLKLRPPMGSGVESDVDQEAFVCSGFVLVFIHQVLGMYQDKHTEC